MSLPESTALIGNLLAELAPHIDGLDVMPAVEGSLNGALYRIPGEPFLDREIKHCADADDQQDLVFMVVSYCRSRGRYCTLHYYGVLARCEIGAYDSDPNSGMHWLLGYGSSQQPNPALAALDALRKSILSPIYPERA